MRPKSKVSIQIGEPPAMGEKPLAPDATAKTQSDKRQLKHWGDVALTVLGLLSVVGGIGHFLDWRTSHSPQDLKMAVGFAILLPIVFLVSRKRLALLIGILLCLVLFGTLGSILHRSLAAAPLIIASVLLLYLLLKWKGKEL